MKLLITGLAILFLVMAAIPTWAGDNNAPIIPTGPCSPQCGCYCPPGTYNNGPINGTTDAWLINFGYIVGDSFTLPANYSPTVATFQFGVWEYPGDTMSSVLWSISSVPNPPNARSILAFGIATQRGGSGGTLSDSFISMNQYGYDIDLVTVSGLDVSIVNGQTYWLNLQNAAVPSGDPVYWDENSGNGCFGVGCPSRGFESALGTIPSEAFTINPGGGCCGTTHGPSDTPEPSSLTLFGSGLLAILGVVRCKLHF